MSVWRAVRDGWVEALVAALLMVLSLSAGLGGRIPALSVGLDVAAFAVALLALRWLRIGVAASLVVSLLVVLLDPAAMGIALYLCMMPALTAIRRDQIPLAVLLTAVNVGAGWATSTEKAGEAPDVAGVLAGWAVLYAIVWGVGLAMRGTTRREASRLAEVRHDRTLQLLELQDSVCRDLSLIVMHGRAAAEGHPSEDLLALLEVADVAERTSAEVARRLAEEFGTRVEEPGSDREPADKV